MGVFIKGGPDESAEKVPIGTHLAVLAGCWDLGVRAHPRFGPRHELCLWWETQARDSQGRQFGVRDVVGATLSPKGYLRKRVEALLGRPMTEVEANTGVDISALVGRVAQITLTPPTKDANGYPFVTACVGLPHGMNVQVRAEGNYTTPPKFVQMTLANESRPPQAAPQGQPAQGALPLQQPQQPAQAAVAPQVAQPAPQPQQPPQPLPAAASLPPGWRAAVDPRTGRTYYAKPDGSSTWDPPPPAAAAPPPAAPPAAPPPGGAPF